VVGWTEGLEEWGKPKLKTLEKPARAKAWTLAD